MFILFRKYLYLNICSLTAKEVNISPEKIIENHVNYLNNNKDSEFTFNTFCLNEGSNLYFDSNNNKFLHNKKEFDIFNLINNNIKKPSDNNEKGLLKFIINKNFYYSNKDSILEKVGNNLVGRKKSISFLKKTYKLEDFIGSFILMGTKVDLSRLSYKIIQNEKICIFVFYRKEYKGLVNNYSVFVLDKDTNKVHYALICIDGDYQLFRIENNTEKHKNMF